MFFLILLLAAGSSSPTTLEVSAGDGEAGIHAAIAKARQRHATIRLQSGTYFFTQPLKLGPDDSDLIIEAQEPGKVILSGGKRITSWKRTTLTAKEVWAADVEKRGFRQLWVNGQRRTRARHPNSGYLAVASVPDVKENWQEGNHRFAFMAGDVPELKNPGDAEAVVMNRWVESRLPVESIDQAKHVITFGRRSTWRLDEKDPYYVEGAREFLDAPGEWYLDPREGRLYYMPLPGEEIQKAEVIAPVLERVMVIEGEPAKGKYVERVTIRGITFSHTEWTLPPAPTTGVTASFPFAGGGFVQAAVGVPAAVSVQGARDCTFEQCEISHVGTYGIELGRGCQNNRISACRIFDLGAGGVKLGETAQRPEAERTFKNSISDCRIHDGGKVFHSAVGIFVGESFNNTIEHNEIRDFYYTGISIGWSWGYGNTLTKGNIVQQNHVHHIGKLSDGDGPILSDMGGIYTLGVQPGTVIRENKFHDIAAIKYGGWGIYLDEGSSNVLVEKNLVYRTTHGGFHQHYGRENVIRNNVFALGRDYQVMRTRAEEHKSFTFERNIVYWKTGGLLHGDFAGSNYAFDRNLYWREGGGEIRFGKLTLEQWRATGMDQKAVVADPMFVDPAKDDFALREDSPASKMGFEGLVLRKIGPRRAIAPSPQ